MPQRVVQQIRRTRRRPWPTQFDYLHLRRLAIDIARELTELRPAPRDVLDLFCGTRPYEDLLPDDARCVGLDIEDRYGVADVVTRELLPFANRSFDLVLCTEAFYYIEDPHEGVAEIRRVLRPGGTAIVTVPFIWAYDRRILEHRFTGSALAALFHGWDGVRVVENGGYAVSWSTLTGSIVKMVENRLPPGISRLARPMFLATYLTVNSIGVATDHLERWLANGPYILPTNLLLSARRPGDD